MTESAVTYKGQTTLPKPVRQALGLEAGDRLRYLIGDDGTVRIMAVRPLAEMAGLLQDAGREALSLEEMDQAIAEGALGE